MSLPDSVTFLILIEQLTAAERRNFIQNLLDTNIDLLTKALFSYFKPGNTHNVSKQNLNQNLNQEISQIIRNRKQKIACIKTKNIDQFTDALIGKIASYLSPKDYGYFSMTNRSIFVGCNNPNTLQKIKFCRSIRHIIFFPVLHTLKTLFLDSMSDFSNKHDLNKLWFGTPQLENLNLQCIREMTPSFDIKYMKQHLPALRRLLCYDIRGITYPLLQTFANQLSFLAMDDILISKPLSTHFSSMNFVNLTEFQYKHWHYKVVNLSDIFYTATKLRKVKLNFATYLFSSDIKPTVDALNTLLLRCQSLEFLHIRQRGDESSRNVEQDLWKAIEQVFKNNIHLLKKKETLRLRLEINSSNIPPVMYLASIIKSISNVKYWSLCIATPYHMIADYQEYFLKAETLKLDIKEYNRTITLIIGGNMQYDWINTTETWQMQLDDTCFYENIKLNNIYQGVWSRPPFFR